VLERVELEEKRLDDYRDIIGEEIVSQIRELSAPLRDARILHINATSFGGGVAEVLASLVPLMRDVGLDAEWQVIEAGDEFYDVTKACHNGLQGMPLAFTDEMKDIWRLYNRMNAEKMEGRYDMIVVHDPQPAGLLHYNEGVVSDNWVWRCHIDTSRPNLEYWEFFERFVVQYALNIFTMPQFVGPGIPQNHVLIIPPSIDPLSPKNIPMDPDRARHIATDMGVDVSRPFVTQISRFDPWKDQLGLIDAYHMIKPRMRDLQLVLVGSMATDDPEGWQYLDMTIEHAQNDPDIHILKNRSGEEVGALQAISDIIVQKSIREGFGLTVSEALWKGRAVVAGDAGGIHLQVIDGETGYLVDSVQECAEMMLYLLQHPEQAVLMGQAGREHVRQNFLTTRHLMDYLRLAARMLNPVAEPTGQPAARPAGRPTDEATRRLTAP